MPRLAVAQIDLKVGDVASNVAQACDLIAEAAVQGAQLVVLPECCNTGLALGRLGELAEPQTGRTREVLAQAAADAGAWVVAGFVEQGPDLPYNASLVLAPDGELVAVYRKCYLYLDEALGFARGRRAVVQDLDWAVAGITICYDYVFPEYIRELVMRGARLLVHSTAWVDTADCRRLHYPAAEAYRALLQTRALENGIFVASANNYGPYDPSGALQCVGQSCIIAPWGELLAEVGSGSGVAVADADFARAADWAATAAPYLSDFVNVPRPV
jgi:predicted amidohydrolase